MLLGFCYLYKFAVLFLIFLQKAENNRLKKKASWPKCCNITFLFLFKLESVGPVDQQINLVSPCFNGIPGQIEHNFYHARKRKCCDM